MELMVDHFLYMQVATFMVNPACMRVRVRVCERERARERKEEGLLKVPDERREVLRCVPSSSHSG